MKNIVTMVLGSMVLFLCASCAVNVQMASHEQDVLAKTFQAPSDKSLIYLIRISKFTGSMLVVPPVVDRLAVGNLKNGSYAVVEVTPGKHVISVMDTFEGNSIIKIDTEAGKLYFIKMHISTGWAAPKITLEAINEDEGRKLVNEYELIETL